MLKDTKTYKYNSINKSFVVVVEVVVVVVVEEFKTLDKKKGAGKKAIKMAARTNGEKVFKNCPKINQF